MRVRSRPSTVVLLSFLLGAELWRHYDVCAPMQAVIPPPTGYGDHEDSLGSVYKLVPKPPKRDYNKLMEFDGEVCVCLSCRFAAESSWVS